MLAEQARIEVRDAFEMLRRYCRNHGRRLRDVAAEVIAGELCADDAQQNGRLALGIHHDEDRDEVEPVADARDELAGEEVRPRVHLVDRRGLDLLDRAALDAGQEALCVAPGAGADDHHIELAG